MKDLELLKYFKINSRAYRTEFWIIVLLIASVTLLPAYFVFEPYSPEAMRYVDIMSLVTLWPLIAVQVRRWHDRNKSGWWFFINFIPVIGLLWVIVELGFLPSVNENNNY